MELPIAPQARRALPASQRPVGLVEGARFVSLVDFEDLHLGFNEIILPPGAARHEHPDGFFPQTLHVGTRSLPRLDLVYRTFALRAPLRLSWQQVYGQFGRHPDKTPAIRTQYQMFRRAALRELKKIKLAWTELNYSTAPGVLILHPSTPAIAPVESIPTHKLISRFRAVSGPSAAFRPFPARGFGLSVWTIPPTS